MKPAILLSSFAMLAGSFGIAQKITLTPQLGVEQGRSAILVNNVKNLVSNFSSPSIGLRLNVAVKSGHGFYANAATNRSGVAYNFLDPETAASDYAVQPANMRLILGAGYQFNSRKIKLGCATAARSTQHPVGHTPAGAYGHGGYGGRCAGLANRQNDYRPHCGASARQQHAQKAKSWYMTLQPSLGLAFATNNSQGSTYNPNDKLPYSYTAGQWKSAIVPGISAEFGEGNKKEFTISLNYLHGIGKFGEQQIEESNALKTSSARFASNASAWTLQVGLPLGLNKSTHAAKSKSKCLYYRAKCQRYRTI